MHVLTAALALAVAGLAVGAFAPAGAPDIVPIAAGEGSLVSTKAAVKKPAAKTKAAPAGEASPEVLAEEWIATGGGSGGGGSPKG
jgi:hypothetical protein